jgi:hypothetical protein
MFDARCPVLTGLVLLGLSIAPARSDVAWTLQERLEGKVAFQDGGLVVGAGDAARSVRWDDLLLVVRGTGAKDVRPLQAVRMLSGEVFGGDVTSCTARSVRLRSWLLGQRQLDSNLVRAVVFDTDALPAGNAEKAERPRTLYRRDGPPLPGELLAVYEDRLTLNGPLGVMAVPLENVTHYVYNVPTAPGAAGDEVRLTDGSVLAGALALHGDSLEVRHGILGSLKIPIEKVRAIVRRPASVVYLTEPAKDCVKTFPLIRARPASSSTGPGDTGKRPEGNGTNGTLLAPAEAERLGCIHAIRLQPRMAVRYALPPSSAGAPKTTFRATLAGVDGAREAVKVSVRADGPTGFQEQVVPSAKAVPVNVDVTGARELVIEVDFAERVVFPSGVVLCDPHLIRGGPG